MLLVVFVPQVGAKMVEDPYKLLVVDSIMALFRTDFTGRGELAERQQKLGQMMALLKKVTSIGVAKPPVLHLSVH